MMMPLNRLQRGAEVHLEEAEPPRANNLALKSLTLVRALLAL